MARRRENQTVQGERNSVTVNSQHYVEMLRTFSSTRTAYVMPLPLSPTLFNFYIDEVTRARYEDKSKFLPNSYAVNCLLFADDIAIITNSEDN
ncbi:hypothetical protein ANN_11171 [Periplaneta americana]|uniref:Reverse transcriptase domain-containing protein n=1 Tax=Periplaneta americana TaxID=6978 RepID=A0ABQ8T5Y6_PERAM|nr:hypothetical protein ANN_11171 [Periplaneta americana]